MDVSAQVSVEGISYCSTFTDLYFSTSQKSKASSAGKVRMAGISHFSEIRIICCARLAHNTHFTRLTL